MASSIKKKLQLNGLWTYRDKYSQEPEGAMLEADNVNLDKLNIASPRVGFETKDQGVTSYLTTSVGNMFNYGNKLVTSSASRPSISTSVVDYSGLPTMTLLSSNDLLPPSIGYHSFAAMSNNLYATSNKGVYGYYGSGYLSEAGVYKPQLPTSVVYGSLLPTPWTKKQMAYRVVFYRLGADGTKYFGAPSDRLWVFDEANPFFGVQLSIIIPANMVGDLYVQVYRTRVVTYDSAIAGSTEDLAGDDEFLVNERSITSTGLPGTYISIYDYTVDSLAGAALYTNTSQEGIEQANNLPPLSNVLETYSNRLFFGGVTAPASGFFTMTARPSNTETLVVDIGSSSETFTFLNTPTTGTHIQIYDTENLPLDLQTMADELISAINLYFVSTLSASRGDAGVTAQIAIQVLPQASSSVTGFKVYGTSGTDFSPSLSTTLPATNFAESTQFKNRIMYSKPNEPEAVPTMNYIDVGDPAEGILALKTLRDRLIIIKERSVWKLMGSDLQSFALQLLDPTTSVVDGRTVQTLSNKLYALSLQGIVSISESVQIISRRVTDLLVDKSAAEAAAWTDEEHGLYVLNPALHTAGENKLIVYSVLNDNFTTWSFTEDPTDVYYTPHMGITINSRMVMGVKNTVDAPTYSTYAKLMCQRGLWSSDASYGDGTLYVKYSSTNSDGTMEFIAGSGVAGWEVVDITTTTPPAGGSYFVVYDGTATSVAVWMKLDSSPSSAPAGALDYTRQKMVTLTTGMTATQVATAIQTAFVGETLLNAVAYGNKVTINATTGGTRTNAFDVGTGFTFSTVAQGGDAAFFADGLSRLEVGTKLYQVTKYGAPKSGILQVTEVDVSGATATLRAETVVSPTISTNAQDDYYNYSFATPTKAVMTWWPFIGEGIEVYKEFKELAVVSEVPVSGAITASFTTDLESQESDYTVSSSNQALGWGQFPWGQAPWGGSSTPKNKVERMLVPSMTSKAHELNTTIEVFSNRQKWEISGISLNYRNIGFTSQNRGDT